MCALIRLFGAALSRLTCGINMNDVTMLYYFDCRCDSCQGSRVEGVIMVLVGVLRVKQVVRV